jgi:VWFA-related protein
MPNILVRTVIFIAVFSILTLTVVGQDQCVPDERIQSLQKDLSAKAGTDVPDPELRNELIKLRADHVRLMRGQLAKGLASIDQEGGEQKAVRSASERMCAILNVKPWPVPGGVERDGVAAWIYLTKNHFSHPLQLRLVPLIATAIKTNEVDKDNDLASLIDRLRLRAGLRQLFGTQASIKDGFLLLAPLQSEANIDKWRAEYGLPSLREYLRSLEINYRAPLIRSTAKPIQIDPIPTTDPPTTLKPADFLASGTADEKVVKIETSLIFINAVVFDTTNEILSKEDFRVFEDGNLQEIEYFKPGNAPFDLVLLLDLSGSTADQLGVINKTTKRFLEMKRDVDRVSIITFGENQTIVSPLETDSSRLLRSVANIRGEGSSKVWDALKFAIGTLGNETGERRKAVVFMTDGADNALLYQPGYGSSVLFSEIVEQVRNSEIAVFPIYLDTEGPDRTSAKVYADARRTLNLIADESGGNYYAAKKISDLSRVYERVLIDIGRSYTIGYSSTNPTRDSTWRAIRVDLPGKLSTKIKTRLGYYAK